MSIERSGGIGIGMGYVAGGGYTGCTEDLDATVQAAAELLMSAYGMPVTIRFNSDRRSGGAWLKTDEPDGIWLNAEVGICASLVTAEGNERFAAKYPEMRRKLRIPGNYIFAHVGERVGEKAHAEAPSIEAALTYLLSHADLRRLRI